MILLFNLIVNQGHLVCDPHASATKVPRKNQSAKCQSLRQAGLRSGLLQRSARRGHQDLGGGGEDRIGHGPDQSLSKTGHKVLGPDPDARLWGDRPLEWRVLGLHEPPLYNHHLPSFRFREFLEFQRTLYLLGYMAIQGPQRWALHRILSPLWTTSSK